LTNPYFHPQQRGPQSPYRQCAPGESEAGAQPCGGGHSMAVVVVVEPDEGIRLRMTRSLREADLVVVEAADGLEAIRTVFAARPQAIVMNRDATGIDGLELLRVLRAACDVPLIVLSADMRPTVTVR